MSNEIEPHIARIIRDKTLKRVGSDIQKLDDILLSSPAPQYTSPRKSVKQLADFFYTKAKEKDLAIIKINFRTKKPKKKTALIGVWSISGETLYAIGLVIKGFPFPEAFPMLEVRVRDHAIERVSQRLSTIDDILIRDELSVAAGSILLSMALGDTGEFYAKTPHGVALVRKFEDGTTVLTTWISNEMLKSGQIKKEWEAFSDNQPATIETSNGEKIFVIQEQSPDTSTLPNK